MSGFGSIHRSFNAVRLFFLLKIELNFHLQDLDISFERRKKTKQNHYRTSVVLEQHIDPVPK